MRTAGVVLTLPDGEAVRVEAVAVEAVSAENEGAHARIEFRDARAPVTVTERWKQVKAALGAELKKIGRWLEDDGRGGPGPRLIAEPWHSVLRTSPDGNVRLAVAGQSYELEQYVWRRNPDGSVERQWTLFMHVSRERQARSLWKKVTGQDFGRL